VKIIRDVFTTARPIDRPIEKVIDYAATEEARLEREIAEYEVTESVERGIRRFLEAFDEGARQGSVTEIGVWVSGFYGSGKSSLTKYLGLALDRRCKIKGQPFVDRLADRIHDVPLRALLKQTTRQHKTAVFMLDLGTDQLAESASDTVTNVLYWNILKRLGYSKERKVADLEIRLERDQKLDAFKAAYLAKFPKRESWDEIHDDPVLAVLRASSLVPSFYPDDYKDESDFRQLRYQSIEDVKEVAKRVLDLVRRRTGCESVVFFVDEVGQYVAPRKELILNLDGLARAFKEIGKGKVWIVATAQQTLTEISERASLNSADLFKLKDRFPIAIELEATDIREITAQRLLTKNAAGEATLKQKFRASGDLLELHAHLADWQGGTIPLDADTFTRFYPFVPSRFELVLDLIRALARRTGGTGLRSAIRLVQDLLVDASRVLPVGIEPVANRPLGQLVTVDDIYDTLRQDLRKEHPQAVEGVERIAKHSVFRSDGLAIRVAKAVAALQPLERRPRTAENIAALLYRDLGSPGAVEAVRTTLHRLVDAQEFGLVELRAEAGAAGGVGFLFLSDEVQPLQKKRDQYVPSTAELNRARVDILRGLFDPPPSTRLEGVKEIQGGVRLGKTAVVGESNDVVFRLEELDPSAIDSRLGSLETETQSRHEHANAVFWLFATPADADDRLREVCRSAFIQAEGSRTKDRERSLAADVSRYLRSEEQRAERAKDSVRASYGQALLGGWFVFQGLKRPVSELGPSVLGGANAVLGTAAKKLFHHFELVKRNVPGDVAARFLEVSRPDQMPRERDPLGLLQTKAGRPNVNIGHPALDEALRAFRSMVAAAGSGRVQGSALLDFFHAAPYGWTKDTTRYIFAALLVAGEIELHGGDGTLRTAGPKAVEAFRNTQSFGRVGVAPRGQPIPMEALDRASRRLEEMFAVEVLPLEDQIARVVRLHFPALLEVAGALPDRLRLLRLPGEARARAFLSTCADLLKEDAGGAASLLGAVSSDLPADAKWASGVTRALNNGGENEIAAARELVTRAFGLAELFPVAEILTANPGVAAIDEILTLDSFHERLVDLRESSRQVEAAMRTLEESERSTLVARLASVREELEVRPSWAKLALQDQLNVIAELDQAGLIAESSDAFVQLSRVLSKGLASLSLADVLARKVDALAVRRPIDVDPERELAQHATGAVEHISMSSLLPAEALRTAADVEHWIARLREQLLERVAAGPIRLTGVE
jgi:hypothetical protein